MHDDLLPTVHVDQHCHECGGSYQVTLYDLLAEHRLLSEWSPARSCTACSTDFYLLLQAIPESVIASLEQAWQEVVQAAEAAGIALRMSGD